MSSASHWVQGMSERLKGMFGVPVAVPTCNGFSSLVLALQAADVSRNLSVSCSTLLLTCMVMFVSHIVSSCF